MFTASEENGSVVFLQSEQIPEPSNRERGKKTWFRTVRNLSPFGGWQFDIH